MDDRAWGTPTEDIAVSIHLRSPRIKLGRPIELELAVKNVGAAPTRIPLSSPWGDFTFKVVREDGLVLRELKYVEDRKVASEAGRHTKRMLAPGQVLTNTEDVSKAYDFSWACSYRIVAAREVEVRGSDDVRFTKAVSNELTFQIVR